MSDGNEDPAFSRRAFLRGATGAAASAGAAGTAAAQESGNKTESGGGGDGGGGGGPTKTVEVGPGGNLVFTPGTQEPLKITPGTTVEFVWKSDDHNIVVGEQPADANWQGTPGGKSKTYDTGYTYTHTFETLGKYNYWCQPHKTAGMVADIEVVESISTPQAPSVPQVPESAKALGVASSVAMVATLGLAFFFLKYGGEYEPPEE